MNAKVIATGVIGLTSLVIGLKSVNTLDMGEIHVKQSLTGDVSVITKTGPYVQALGDVYEYTVAPTQKFKVRAIFRDGSKADVTGTVKVKLPANTADMKAIHEDFKGFKNLNEELLTNMVTTITQTTTRFDAEDAYSVKKAELIKLIQDSIVNGQYATNSDEITKVSLLKKYNIKAVNINIDVNNFDARTQALIDARKESEQQETLAKANAVRAKQDAITEEEKGKANVAKAKYEALVIKERAVVEAQKATEVQKEILEQQKLKAQAELERGKAQAEAAKLKVAAGLTPLEEATIEKETAIGVAKAMAGINLPKVMVVGGAGKGQGTIDPFTAVGLNQFLDISKKMASGK